MNLDEALYLLLTADATLTAYFTDVQAQIVFGDDQKFTLKPRIIFERISDPRQWRKPERWQRWRFNVTETKVSDCEAIAARVAFLMTGYGTSGTVNIWNSQVMDGGASPEWDQDINAYKTYVDVRISYEG